MITATPTANDHNRSRREEARPPVATERLSRLEDGRLLYRLKHRWRDGTTHVVFEPQDLVEKLAALVPPPRFHLVRYHGILGPCASGRDWVVPGGSLPGHRDGSSALACFVALPDAKPKPDGRRSREPDLDSQLDLAVHETAGTAMKIQVLSDASPSAHGPSTRPRRLAWAELLRRVFAVDVLECPRCGGRMRLLATIHPPQATQAILECLDLPARAPPTTAPLPDDTGIGASWEEDFEAGV